jgi:hypothetical protein
MKEDRKSTTPPEGGVILIAHCGSNAEYSLGIGPRDILRESGPPGRRNAPTWKARGSDSLRVIFARREKRATPRRFPDPSRVR